MGLFDKIIQSNTSLTKQEAFLAVLLVTVAADGNVANQEIQDLVTISNRMQLFQGVTPAALGAMISKAGVVLKSSGVSGLLSKSADAMTPELRVTAFARAVDMVFADGVVDNSEKQMLELIQKAMGVSDELAIKIVEVIQIKNSG